MKRKKVLLCGLAIIVCCIFICGCESTVSTESATQSEEIAQQIGQEKTAEQMSMEQKNGAEENSGQKIHSTNAREQKYVLGQKVVG